MPWARLDDRFHRHRKVRRAGLEATGLYAMALSYCAEYLTDGYVDEDWLEDVVRSARRRERLLSQLVDQGLFDRNGKGILIHDYLVFNPSRADIEARRKREAEKKARQRMSRGDSHGDR